MGDEFALRHLVLSWTNCILYRIEEFILVQDPLMRGRVESLEIQRESHHPSLDGAAVQFWIACCESINLNEQIIKISFSDITNEMVVTTRNPRQDPIVHPFLQPEEHCVRDVLRVRDLDVFGSISTGLISTSITDPCSCSSSLRSRGRSERKVSFGLPVCHLPRWRRSDRWVVPRIRGAPRWRSAQYRV